MDLDREFTKGWNVETLRYYSSATHKMIGIESHNGQAELDSIGENGRNLTFAVLSMNRADNTIRLMRSIAEQMPEFEGEFLIGDNGSSDDQLDMLYDFCEKVPYRCRILEFKKNYGVAAGRNKLFKEVQTEWIIAVDNDVYFVGNPLKKIQQDICQLGCHFMCLPTINQEHYDTFVYGGHLYLDNLNGHVNVGGGSVLINPHVQVNIEHEPFLCTFISGCANILKKDTFFYCGGYEEKMFVGFEDTEFSVRVFQKGFKVGTCGVCCIIHDHPKPKNDADTHYEKQRFSVNYLQESAKVFEKKHGFAVWNPNVAKWIDQRRDELISEREPGKTGLASSDEKPGVALIVDKPDWALDHIAKQVQKNLASFYDFKIIYLKDFDNLAEILMLAEDCKIIHFLWRPLASDFYSAYTQNRIHAIGMDSDSFYRKYVAGKVISVAVYDHLLLDGPEAFFTSKLFTDENTIVSSYTVSSEKLMKLYNERKDIRLKPSAITQDGVDLSLFKPENLERFENVRGRTIRIGWVGNSKWQVRDLKGINTVIKPAIDQLIGEGYNVELVTSDRNDRMIPHEKMPGYYNQIDLYVCASLCEGTPNPVLEAMACGVPVISTDVGLIPEAFGPKQMQYVLRERSTKCLADAIRRLMEHPEDFAALSEENLKQIQKWDWPLMTQNFKRYFDRCLAQKEES